jgi:WD40 repeat protein
MNDNTKSILSDKKITSNDTPLSMDANSDELCKSYIYKGYHTGRICSVALTTLKDGRRIAASASHDRTVRIWNLDDKSEIRIFNLPDFVSRVFLVIGTNSRSYVVCYIFALCAIHVYDVITGEEICQFNGNSLFYLFILLAISSCTTCKKNHFI